MSDIDASPDTKTLTRQLQDFPEPITPPSELITPLHSIMKTEIIMSPITNPEVSEEEKEEENNKSLKRGSTASIANNKRQLNRNLQKFGNVRTEIIDEESETSVLSSPFKK